MEKARLLAGTGNFKAAVEAGDRAISLEPWYFDADLNLGYYYFKLGQIEEARKRIGTLSAMYTNWPVASLNDSGYRKTVLHKDEEALRRALAILQ
jgi:tetratricopeptide (TPR) repeat protein